MVQVIRASHRYGYMGIPISHEYVTLLQMRMLPLPTNRRQQMT